MNAKVLRPLLVGLLVSAGLFQGERARSGVTAPPRRLKLRPLRAAALPGAPVPALRPAERARLARKAGFTVPPGGITSSVTLTPRDGYKGQSAYLVFTDAWVDLRDNSVNLGRGGGLQLFFRTAAPNTHVLLLFSGIVDGSGIVNVSSLAPTEMGDAPEPLNVAGNRTLEHSALVVDCGNSGWYQARAFVTWPHDKGTYLLKRIEVSLID